MATSSGVRVAAAPMPSRSSIDADKAAESAAYARGEGMDYVIYMDGKDAAGGMARVENLNAGGATNMSVSSLISGEADLNGGNI